METSQVQDVMMCVIFQSSLNEHCLHFPGISIFPKSTANTSGTQGDVNPLLVRITSKGLQLWK